MTLNLDNSELIERCAAHDRNAMELLYSRTRTRMLRVIRHYVKDEDAANDILHDGYVVIFSRIAAVRNAGSLELWMARIMKNLSLRYLADQDLTTLIEEDIEDEEAPDFDELLTMEELEMLINRLPAGYQQVFRLAVLENKSHKEIGDILGIAPHSSSSQLSHARAMLRQIIREHRAAMGVVLLLLAVAATFFILRDNDKNISEKDSPEPVLASSTTKVENASDNSEAPANPVISTERPAGKQKTSFANVVTVGSEELPATEDTIGNKPVMEISEELMAERENEVTEPSTEPSTEPRDSVSNFSPYEKWETVSASHTLTASTGNSSKGWSITANSQFIGADINNTHDDYYVSDTGNSGSTPAQVWRDAEVDAHFPVEVAASVSKDISGRFGVTTGLTYTYQSSELRLKSSAAKSSIYLHTLGIPLKVNYRLFTYKRFSLHVGGGFQVDFPVKHAIKVHDSYNKIETPSYRFRPQWSVGVGIKAGYDIFSHTSLYVEPTLRYYFDNGTSLPVYWYKHPLTFTLPIGIQFHW